MEISEKGKELVEEAEREAKNVRLSVSRPLLMDGDGHFYSTNGNVLRPAEVLQEHQKMRRALELIHSKLDAANCQITATFEVE